MAVKNPFRKRWEIIDQRGQVAGRFMKFDKAEAVRDQLNWQTFERGEQIGKPYAEWYQYTLRPIN